MGNANQREMQMDTDRMSYEELLALGDRIGYVNTGLTEDTISRHLKTRKHKSSAKNNEEKNDYCVICLTNYKNKEKIGKLDCGHDYHGDCVKKWLVIKNNCPICKSSALTTKSKDSTRGLV